ncbi:ABC transporter permease [Rhizobacter sp. LjRoot28]|uniref:ABC transporter permease n=1 Tax=Rhizobacter sp. LjRoot28 TaxID=3342309 RepID=UPI003ECD1721
MSVSYSSSSWRAQAGERMLRSPSVVLAVVVLALLMLAALLAPVLTPHRPFDLETLDLLSARLPPGWIEAGEWRHVLGTDGQGRDVLASIMYGLRVSLIVGVASVTVSLLVGVTLGVIAGYCGGLLDALVMRACDVMLSFPPILVALLVDGIGRMLVPGGHDAVAVVVLVIAIAMTGWVQYARTTRASTLVEREKDYIAAARLIGVGSLGIIRRHLLPNVMGPVMVLATLQFGTAILIEATLSFLGVGVPSTSPSLGTLIRIGNELLLSGDWWIALFPGAVLVLLVLCINVVGDALRDALNPRLR